MVTADGERRKREASRDSVEVIADDMIELGVSIDALRRELVKRGERYDFPLQVDLRKGLESGGWQHVVRLDGEELKGCVAADAELGIALVYADTPHVRRTRPCDCEPGLHMATERHCTPLKVLRGVVEIEAKYTSKWTPGLEFNSPFGEGDGYSITFTALPIDSDAIRRQGRLVREAMTPARSEFRHVLRDAIGPELYVHAPRAELEIHRLDGDPHNNDLDNLALVDPSENRRSERVLSDEVENDSE